MRLLALRSPWVVTGVTAKAAQSTASCRVRATRALTFCGSSRIALEDGLSLPCRDGHRIERRQTLGWRCRVQALEAGAQGAQALGGLQPRRSPHPALDVVHEDPAAVGRGVEHGRRHGRGSRSAVAGHLAQRVSPRSRPFPDSLPQYETTHARVDAQVAIHIAAAMQQLHAQGRFAPGATRNVPQDRCGDHPAV